MKETLPYLGRSRKAVNGYQSPVRNTQSVGSKHGIAHPIEALVVLAIDRDDRPLLVACRVRRCIPAGAHHKVLCIVIRFPTPVGVCNPETTPFRGNISNGSTVIAEAYLPDGCVLRNRCQYTFVCHSLGPPLPRVSMRSASKYSHSAPPFNGLQAF